MDWIGRRHRRLEPVYLDVSIHFPGAACIVKIRDYVQSYGADYKAALFIPTNQASLDIKSMKEEIVKSVTGKVSSDFGHILKEFDSFGSQVFLSFCKNFNQNGVGLPQNVRKIQKCCGSENTFMPTVDAYI